MPGGCGQPAVTTERPARRFLLQRKGGAHEEALSKPSCETLLYPLYWGRGRGPEHRPSVILAGEGDLMWNPRYQKAFGDAWSTINYSKDPVGVSHEDTSPSNI